MNLNRPRCGCGNTQDPEGFCDGSHSSQSGISYLLLGLLPQKIQETKN